MITLVIPNYRRADLVRRCLDSVGPALDALGQDAETIVVDDGSNDGSASVLAADYPWAVFMVLRTNRGYAGAVNAGVGLARGEWVLTLNNDVTVERGAISELQRVASGSPEIGSVGALMLFAEEHRRDTINSAGMGLDRLCVPFDRLLGQPAGAAGSRPVEVFAACGGAAMYRRSMLESIGGIDDTFEAYFEDIDVSWRARMAGWRCVFAPSAVVYHEHSATTKHGSDSKYWLVGRNRVRLVAKNATTTHLLLYWPLMVAYDCSYVVYAALADRTSAPLRGRIRGLREWSRYRKQVPRRRPVRTTRIEGLRRALKRRQTWLASVGARVSQPQGPPPQPASVRSPPDFRGARVAIVHDWFQGYHGSERVVETMLTDVFRAAETVDILTFHAAREVIPDHLANAIVRESRVARLPGVRQRGHHPGRWRLLLPYMPLYFRRLDLSDYDIVVASSHACAVNVRPRKDATFVCYCYTPMRYAWMPQLDGRRVSGVRAGALRAMRGCFKRLDRASAQRVDRYATLSSAVAERIQSFYGRKSEVIFAPADVQDFTPDGSRREPGHFLWVHRFVTYKQPELVAEAFRGLPYRVTMVGVGPLRDRVRQSASDNVTVHGWLERDELIDLFERAAGFIHVGEEDFGISMVEALAAGVPVLAYNAGGARDIVRPGQDGVLLDRLEVADLREGIEEIARGDWDPAQLRARAETFSRARFATQFAAFVARTRDKGCS